MRVDSQTFPRIAFVHIPHQSQSARLDTMPFALNSVVALGQAGWPVDVYIWEEPNPSYQQFLPETVTLHYCNIILQYFIAPIPGWWYRWKQFLNWRQFQRQHQYHCVFGVGQIGLYIASLLATSSRCPLVYYNDEFPSAWGEPNYFWTDVERRVVAEVDLIVVPDSQRIQPLQAEMPACADKPHTMLPNIPTPQAALKIDWHQRLGLPAGTIPFLHAGSISDWTQTPELLSSVPYWPENTVLIMNGRSPGESAAARKLYVHLEVPDRIFWNEAPLPTDEINSLVTYCAGNFALYRHLGNNIEYAGYSSGKLMRSLLQGVPVIATRLISFQFVEEYSLGVLVQHPAEIPAAIATLLADQEGYRTRCLKFCREAVAFEPYWQRFCQQLQAITGISLLSSLGSGDK